MRIKQGISFLQMIVTLIGELFWELLELQSTAIVRFKSALPISLCGFCIHSLQYMLSFHLFVAIALITAPVNFAIVSKLQRTNQICPFLLSL